MGEVRWNLVHFHALSYIFIQNFYELPTFIPKMSMTKSKRIFQRHFLLALLGVVNFLSRHYFYRNIQKGMLVLTLILYGRFLLLNCIYNFCVYQQKIGASCQFCQAGFARRNARFAHNLAQLECFCIDFSYLGTDFLTYLLTY